MSDIDAMKFFRALDKRDRVGIGGVFELLTDRCFRSSHCVSIMGPNTKNQRGDK